MVNKTKISTKTNLKNRRDNKKRRRIVSKKKKRSKILFPKRRQNKKTSKKRDGLFWGGLAVSLFVLLTVGIYLFGQFFSQKQEKLDSFSEEERTAREILGPQVVAILKESPEEVVQEARILAMEEEAENRRLAQRSSLWDAVKTSSLGDKKNGECGDEHFTCKEGRPRAKMNLSNKWKWRCSLTGGDDAVCEMQKPDSAFNTCFIGKYQCKHGAEAINQGENNSYYTWDCVKNGVVSKCTKKKSGHSSSTSSSNGGNTHLLANNNNSPSSSGGNTNILTNNNNSPSSNGGNTHLLANNNNSPSSSGGNTNISTNNNNSNITIPSNGGCPPGEEMVRGNCVPSSAAEPSYPGDKFDNLDLEGKTKKYAVSMWICQRKAIQERPRCFNDLKDMRQSLERDLSEAHENMTLNLEQEIAKEEAEIKRLDRLISEEKNKARKDEYEARRRASSNRVDLYKGALQLHTTPTPAPASPIVNPDMCGHYRMMVCYQPTEAGSTEDDWGDAEGDGSD